MGASQTGMTALLCRLCLLTTACTLLAFAVLSCGAVASASAAATAASTTTSTTASTDHNNNNNNNNNNDDSTENQGMNVGKIGEIPSFPLFLDGRLHRILVPPMSIEDARNYSMEVVSSLYLDVAYPGSEEAIEQHIVNLARDTSNESAGIPEEKVIRERQEPTEPRPWPTSSRPEIVLLWQIDPSDGWSMSLWIRELLSDFTIKEVVDTELSKVIPGAVIVYETGMCESKQGPKFMKYLEQYDIQSLKYGLIHLHDELFGGCRAHYATASFVLRSYGHKSFQRAGRDNVLEFPLGYQTINQQPRRDSTKAVWEREHKWSFAGDASKLWRREMIENMKTYSHILLRK